jgi:small subunit ribosomal protein S2
MPEIQFQDAKTFQKEIFSSENKKLNKKNVNMEVRQQNSKKKDIFPKSSKQRSGRSTVQENFQAGDILSVKITALGSKNIGVAELKNGTTLLVPNTKCGEKVQVKIEKVFFALPSGPSFGPGNSVGRNEQKMRGQKNAESSAVSQQNKKGKYAIGKVFFGDQTEQPEVSEKTLKNNGGSEFQKEKASNGIQFDFKVGQKVQGTIQKKGPKNSGILPLSNNFLILVPNAKVGEKMVFEIQKIKENYAIAKPVNFSENQTNQNGNLRSLESFEQKNKFVGQEFHIDIPSSAKTFGNFFVVKFNGQILFVKKALGVQTNDRVQIQIQKATENFAIAKIQKVSPLSLDEKKAQVKETLQKMIQSSMHFGEKAIHCHANMRKYLWSRKKGLRFSTFQNSSVLSGSTKNGTGSSHAFQSSNLKNWDLPKKGSLSSNSSPDMSGMMTLPGNIQRPLVKRGRHVLNVFKTQHCLNEALKQLAKYAAKGKTFLFVGTKKPAASLIAKTALLSRTSFFVNTRWLGGMLTNWKTILKSIAQIRPILKQKQKIQKKIFEKRQKIQRALFQKVSLLRKKSQKFFTKGKALIAQMLNSQNAHSSLRAMNDGKGAMTSQEKIQKFVQRKNVFFASNLSLVRASKNLKMKKVETFRKIQEFEMAATKILQQKQQLRSFLSKNIQKFNEMEQFFEIGQEFFKLKNSFENKTTKFLAVSTEKFESLSGAREIETNSHVPNPSPEILRKMISILANFKQGTFNTSSSLFNQEFSKKSFLNRPKSAEMTEKSSGKVILFSKFFNKFLAFFPFFQNSLKQFALEFAQSQKILEKFDETLKKILQAQKSLKKIYQKTVMHFSAVCSKLAVQRKNFKAFELNFQQFVAEQRLLKFLPKLRYFPTSQVKMYETIEFFMKKFVDPKLIYPMEQIYDQKLRFTSKKIATTRKQKWQRLEKYFGGMTKMAKMNAKQISKNVAIIIGQQEEMSAVQECRKLGMKIFAIVDTNCDPKIVDHIIPANDDSRNSIHYVLGEMLTYIRLGQKLRRKVAFRGKMQQITRQKRRFSS